MIAPCCPPSTFENSFTNNLQNEKLRSKKNKLNTAHTCYLAIAKNSLKEHVNSLKSFVIIKKQPYQYIRQGFENHRKIPGYLF
jgi:hypothetical protein